jgi:hypothetical protein
VSGSRRFALVCGGSKRRRALAGAFFGGIIALGAQPARAEAVDEALALTWVAPRQCGDAQTLRKQTLRLAQIGADFSGRLVAAGKIEARAGAWHLRLVTTFRGGTGERELTASSCSALTETAALLLALILNPQLEHEPGASSRPEPSAGRAAPLDLQGLAGAHAGATLGVLRHPAAALGGSIGVRLQRIALRVGVSVSPTETAYVSGEAGPGGRAWSLGADLTGCWEPRFGRMYLGPCLGLGVTQIRGLGIGIEARQRAVTSWVSGLLGATAGLRVTRVLHVRAAGFAYLAGHRPRLFIEEIGDVEQPRALGGMGVVGLEVSLP